MEEGSRLSLDTVDLEPVECLDRCLDVRAGRGSSEEAETGTERETGSESGDEGAITEACEDAIARDDDEALER